MDRQSQIKQGWGPRAKSPLNGAFLQNVDLPLPPSLAQMMSFNVLNKNLLAH